MRTYLFISAIAISWLVTPESLVLLAQVAGKGGTTGIGGALLVGVFMIAAATVIHDPKLPGSPEGNGLGLLSQYLGKPFAAAIVMSGRFPVLFFGATAMLVAAGFAFNEIFVYWFPNFLFSGLLLLLVVILNGIGGRVPLYGQLLFMGSTVAGLLILFITATGFNGDHVEAAGKSFSLSFLPLVLLAFLGIDLVPADKHNRRIVGLAFGAGCIIAACWMLVATSTVSSDRLWGSSIAHLSVAKAVGGEGGRVIMGWVIISGVLSGVNGLFLAARNTIESLATAGILPEIVRKTMAIAILFGIIIEAMMMNGMAGELILETQLRASLLLWVFYLAVRCGAIAIWRRAQKDGEVWLAWTVFLVLIVFFLHICLHDPQLMYIVSFILVTFLVCLGIAFICRTMVKKTTTI